MNQLEMRLAALELLVAELLTHCAIHNRQSMVDVLDDARKVAEIAASDTEDREIFQLVSRELEEALERASGQ